MHLHKFHLVTKSYSTSSPGANLASLKSLNWRKKLKQNLLVSEISTILLQRHDWSPLLHQKFNFLPSKLTPNIFHQTLKKTQSNPKISLCFFNWAIKNLGFNPDINSRCHVIQLSQRSGLLQQVKPILDSMMETYKPSVIAESMIRACNGNVDSSYNTLSIIFECYSQKGLFMEALDMYRVIRLRVYNYAVSIHACNLLIDSLQRNNEIRLARCFYGSMFRTGVTLDCASWSLFVQILCKDGKFEPIVRLIDVGVYNSTSYTLVIDHYSKSGNFSSALDRLDEMLDNALNPGFSIYALILDAACKYGNNEVVTMIKSLMIDKGFLPDSECDSIIQKFCDLGKANAAVMFFDAKIILHDATYGCLLKALCKEGCLHDAIRIYRVILEKGIVLKDSCYYAFANLLCDHEDPVEGFELLRDIVGRGFCPDTTELSKFISYHCKRRRWKDVDEFLKVILEKKLLPNGFCCSSLIKHYCSTRRIDDAILLYSKIEAMEGVLDITTYNTLIDGLLNRNRVEEAVKVFGQMKRLNLVTTSSFSIMIRGLCRLKEMRKAMGMHDEMLQMGLKPDRRAYRRLISGFI